MKFCNICDNGDHSLEDILIVLKKIIPRKNVNLLHVLSKEEVRNFKNLHIVTRLGARRDIHSPPQNYQRKKDNNFPNPDKEEKIMREALKFFRNATEDQQNSRSRDEDTIQEFL